MVGPDEDVRGLQLFARFSSTSGAGVTNTYDGFGGLRSSSTNLDGVTRTVVSDYDTQGNRSRITHPDGAYFEYRYDPAGRLTQLTENGPSTPLALLTYDAQGRRDAIGRDTAGAATGFGYDAISRLGAIVHNLDGGGTSNDLTTTFAYNPASQIVTRTQSNSAYEFPVGSSNRAYARAATSTSPTRGQVKLLHLMRRDGWMVTRSRRAWQPARRRA